MMAPSTEDIKRLLAAKVHIGTKNCTHAMSDYLVKLPNEETTSKNSEDKYILDLEKFWDKMILAARVIVAIEKPEDVCVISARPHGKRAVIKFAQFTEASQLPDRFTPGTFTNQAQEKVFMEPRLLILTDPMTDHQALKESSYVNIPVIALCNTDSDLQYVDIAIPCNNRTKSSIALVYWLLARTVRRMRAKETYEEEWDKPVDLFYQRDEEEIKEEEAAAAAEEEEMEQPSHPVDASGGAAINALDTDWDPNAQDTGNWADDDYQQATWPAEAGFGVDPNAPVDPNAVGAAPVEYVQDPNAAVVGGYDPNQGGYAPQQTAYAQPEAAPEYQEVHGAPVFPEHDVEHW